MTKQEALAEIKSLVSIAEWVDADYVDCVPKEALKVAIDVLERFNDIEKIIKTQRE